MREEREQGATLKGDALIERQHPHVGAGEQPRRLFPWHVPRHPHGAVEPELPDERPELVSVPAGLIPEGQALDAADEQQARMWPLFQHPPVRLQQHFHPLDRVEKAKVDDDLRVVVRRDQGITPGEQEAVLAVPPAPLLPPRLERLDGTLRDTAWLQLPPAVLVYRRNQGGVTPGGAQERRQEKDGAL